MKWLVIACAVVALAFAASDPVSDPPAADTKSTHTVSTLHYDCSFSLAAGRQCTARSDNGGNTVGVVAKERTVIKRRSATGSRTAIWVSSGNKMPHFRVTRVDATKDANSDASLEGFSFGVHLLGMVEYRENGSRPGLDMNDGFRSALILRANTPEHLLPTVHNVDDVAISSQDPTTDGNGISTYSLAVAATYNSATVLKASLAMSDGVRAATVDGAAVTTAPDRVEFVLDLEYPFVNTDNNDPSRLALLGIVAGRALGFHSTDDATEVANDDSNFNLAVANDDSDSGDATGFVTWSRTATVNGQSINVIAQAWKDKTRLQPHLARMFPDNVYPAGYGDRDADQLYFVSWSFDAAQPSGAIKWDPSVGVNAGAANSGITVVPMALLALAAACIALVLM